MAIILRFYFQRRPDEALKQRMGFVGAALEFGVELHAHEKGCAGYFYGFHQPPVRGQTGETQARARQRVPVFVGKFIAVAVAFADLLCIVTTSDHGVIFEYCRR